METVEIKNRWDWGYNVFLIQDGYGVLNIDFMDGTDWGHIGGLVVHPSRMKQGIATQLMKRAEEVIVNEGLTLAVLSVERGRLWQIEWYKRLGYEIYGDDEKMLYMSKGLGLA